MSPRPCVDRGGWEVENGQEGFGFCSCSRNEIEWKERRRWESAGKHSLSLSARGTKPSPAQGNVHARSRASDPPILSGDPRPPKIQFREHIFLFMQHWGRHSMPTNLDTPGSFRSSRKTGSFTIHQNIGRKKGRNSVAGKAVMRAARNILC